MPHYREKVAGNYPANDTGNIPAFTIAHGDYLKLVQGAMREEADNRPGAAKYIAAKLKCSPKTVQSWLDGATAPSNILDLRAMNKLPVYAALKRKLAAMESAMDPRVQATIQELHRMSQQLADGGGMGL